MNKKIQLCGIGNGIMDILTEVGEREFQKLQLEKGTMRLVSGDEQATLLRKIITHHPIMASGGSVANSIIAFAQLGGRAGFIGSIGDDEYGNFYLQEMRELGVTFPGAPKAHKQTGTCLSIITPDAERTMRTSLAVSGELSPPDVDEATIANSEWLLIEGYLLANPEFGVPSVRRAIEIARNNGTKIAFTLSEPWVVEVCRPVVDEVVAVTDLLFANEHEAQALTGTSTVADAFAALRARIEILAVTAGSDGAYVARGTEVAKAPAVPCVPKDLTGAGDMFAGSYIYGLLNGLSLEESGRSACFLAAQLITQMGARFHGDLRALWVGSRQASVN